MDDRRQSVGRRGEELAAAFLATKGFTIIDRNWRSRYGEIDLIVKREREIRFVEVKTRLTKQYGHPEEAVTPTKIRHLHTAVQLWLARHPIPLSYGLDVVAIYIDPTGKVHLEWIEGIL